MSEESIKNNGENATGKIHRKRLLSAMDKHGNNISALSKELKTLSAYMRNTKAEESCDSTAIIYPEHEESQNNIGTENFSVIDDFLASRNNEPLLTIDDILKGGQSTDYFPTQEYKEAENIHDPNLPTQISSINSFLDAIKNGDFSKMDTTEYDTQNSKEINSNEDNFENIFIDETFFTESLAKIYIRQRKYRRALEIIKNLSLKYPEKNIYFADQMRFLEKLIINIKTE
ncbi:MAG: hypothetical protein RR293_07115 [Bacteroidales bacterium]